MAVVPAGKEPPVTLSSSKRGRDYEKAPVPGRARVDETWLMPQCGAAEMPELHDKNKATSHRQSHQATREEWLIRAVRGVGPGGVRIRSRGLGSTGNGSTGVA